MKQSDPYKQQYLLRRAEAICQISPDGSAGFTAFEIEEIETILSASLGPDHKIPVELRRTLVWKALSACGRAKDFGLGSFEQQLEKKWGEHLAAPKVKFHFLTTLSISHPESPIRFSDKGSRLRIAAKWPRNFATKKIPLSGFEEIDLGVPSNFARVVTTVAARTSAEAERLSSNIIDLWRASANLFFNHKRRTFAFFSPHPRKPINEIVVGRYRVGYDSLSKRLQEGVWYDPLYSNPEKPKNVGSEYLKMAKWQSQLLAKIDRHPLRTILRQALLRYVRSLDHVDYDAAYLGLWGVLEQLTVTQRANDYKTTVRRASSIYKDRDFALAMLHALKEYRNGYVHASQQSEAVESMIQQLKGIVEGLIFFLYFNRPRLQNLNDVASFFDLSDDENSLRKTARQIRYVLSSKKPDKR